MKQKKTVTEEKLAANRQNAQKSTSPRTGRGKNKSRLNAVETGLFAEHMVIAACDGSDSQDGNPEKQFASLLWALQEEYKSQGPTEVFCVAQMVECMWKQRRVSRSERAWSRPRRS